MNNESSLTSRYLLAGIVAGPFFVVVALLQAFTREGFDYVRHPASLLSLGDGGWIQIANFVLTGLLFVLCGIGLSKVLTGGIGRTWAARLFLAFGVALIMGGVFGAAKEMSWHGTLHAFAPILGFISHVAALIILARRFGSQRQQAWKIMTILAAVAMFVLAAIPNFTADWEKGVFNFLPLWAGVVLGYGWTSFVVATVRKEIGSNSMIKEH